MTLDLDHLSKLAEAATRGPWQWFMQTNTRGMNKGREVHACMTAPRYRADGSEIPRPYRTNVLSPNWNTSEGDVWEAWVSVSQADAELIVTLRNNIQELIRLARLGMERLAEATPTGREYVGKYATQTMLQEATKRAADKG